MGNWWQIYDPALYSSGLCSLFHFLKKQVCQQEMTWDVKKRWEKASFLLPLRTKIKCHTRMLRFYQDGLLQTASRSHPLRVWRDRTLLQHCFWYEKPMLWTYDSYTWKMTNSMTLSMDEIECDVTLKGKPTSRYWEEDQELWSCRQRMSQKWVSTDRASLCRLVQTHSLLVYVV